MSYSNPNVEITYDGNGADQTFGVNFHYLEGQSPVIQVELWDYTNPDVPVKESFVQGVDYTIDESGYPNTEVNTTDPVAVDFKLVMYRSSVPIQTTNLVNGAFPAESVEEGLDKVMMVSQEQDAKMSRALLNPIGGPTLTVNDVLLTIAQTDANSIDISDNSDDIGDNALAIGTNSSNIATNVGNIATNTGNIDTLTTAVGLIAPETLVPVIVSYGASIGEIVLVQADNVTVTLPAPVLSGQIKVKMDGLHATCIISSATGIDGFGTSYTLSSMYESISLVSDGTKWFII